MAETSGRHQEGGPVGVLDGVGLGHGLGEHEDHDDLEDGGDGDADGAERPLGQHADQGGGHQVAQQHQQQDRVEEPLGVLDQREQLPGAPRLSSARVRALTRLMRVRPSRPWRGRRPSRSGRDDAPPSHQHAPSLLTGLLRPVVTAGSPMFGGSGRAAPAPVAPWPRPPRRRRGPCPAGAGCRAPPAAPSRRRRCRRGRGVAARRPPGTRPRRPAGRGTSAGSGSVARPGPERVGRAARPRRVVLVDGEGQHVGGAFLAEEALVQLGHGVLVDEQHRQLGVALHALGLQHRLGQADPAAGRRPARRPARRRRRPRRHGTSSTRSSARS